jgi:hypothetical protein
MPQWRGEIVQNDLNFSTLRPFTDTIAARLLGLARLRRGSSAGSDAATLAETVWRRDER